MVKKKQKTTNRHQPSRKFGYKGDRPKRHSAPQDSDQILKAFIREFDRVRHGSKYDPDKALSILKDPKLVGALKMVKQLRDLYVVPGGLSFLRFARALTNRSLAAKPGYDFGTTIDGLFSALVKSIDEDDERAGKQLETMKRLAWPDLYSMQLGDFNNILKAHQTSASRARALELMGIMGRLSHVVEAKNAANRKKQLVPTSTVIQFKPNIDDYDVSMCGADLLAIARQHVKRNMTLRSLAIAVSGFARDEVQQINDKAPTLQDEITDISVRTLKADLENLSIIDSAPHMSYGHGIQTQPFSSDWKETRKQRSSRNRANV